MHSPPRLPGAIVTRVAASRAFAVGSAALLVLLCLAWELWLAPTGRGTLAIKALPVALALPGLLHSRLYTYRWLSLVVWLYVGEGLVRATSDHGTSALLAGCEVVVSVALFAACGAHVRARLRGSGLVTP